MLQYVKRIGVILLAIVFLFVLAFCAWFVYFDYSMSAENASFVYEDLARFEDVHALVTDAADSSSIIRHQYLRNASRGLDAYADTYGLTPQSMLYAWASAPETYNSTQLTVDNVQARESDIRAGMQRLDELVTRLIIPPTYFFVGRNRAAGSVGHKGIFISIEMYVGSDSTAVESGRHLDAVHSLVVHELVHFTQMTKAPVAYTSNWNNLARAIKEGAADFLAELATGYHINPAAHRYGSAHEPELWNEFKTAMHGHETGDWFFRQPTDGDWPADLGYNLGYRIVKSFYDKSADKHQAIQDIIAVDDYDEFLVESGYNPLASAM